MQMLFYKSGDDVFDAINIESIVHIYPLGDSGKVCIELANRREVTIRTSMNKLLKALQTDTYGPIVIEAES